MALKLAKTKYLLAKIGLGIVVFASTVGIVIALSILFGALRSPADDESGSVTDESASGSNCGLAGVVCTDPAKFSSDIFPYTSEEFSVDYADGTILVYIFPDLAAEGTIEVKYDRVENEAKSWLSENGIDTEASTIEWRSK